MSEAFERAGFWINDYNNGIEIVTLQGGRKFALHGWNGELYGDCWEVSDKYTVKGEERFVLTPEYAEIDHEYEIVGYYIN